MAREARGEREEGRLPCGLAAAWLPPFSVGGGRPPLAARRGLWLLLLQRRQTSPCKEGGDKGKDWLGRLSLSTPSCCSPVVAVSCPERPDRENEPTSPQMTARRCSGNCTVGLFLLRFFGREETKVALATVAFYLRPKADRSWSDPSWCCCWVCCCCWGGDFFLL